MLQDVQQLISGLAANSWFTVVAGIASIWSLLLTFVIARRTKMFGKWLFRRARLPELRKDLDKEGSTLSELLDSFGSNRHAISECLSRTRAIVQNLATKMDGEDRVLARSISRKIAAMGMAGALGEDSVHAVRYDLAELRERLHQAVKDEQRRSEP